MVKSKAFANFARYVYFCLAVKKRIETMKAYIFPGQGSQFPGMGKDLRESNDEAKTLFAKANDILGFDISDIMFNGSAEDLLKTDVTQPAVFIHSYLAFKCSEEDPNGLFAGHSLGEFSALVAAGALSFEDGLRLVHRRALAMKKCCDDNPGTMAAIIGLEPEKVAEICELTSYSHICDESSCRSLGAVVAANFNSDVQTVISGEKDAVEEACKRLKDNGAKRCLPLNVGGAFHSPLMEPARVELAKAIEETKFCKAANPVYQNVTGLPETDPDKIKENLLLQLTSPVKWVDTIKNMHKDGADEFMEFGPGTVLTGLLKKIQL